MKISIRVFKTLGSRLSSSRKLSKCAGQELAIGFRARNKNVRLIKPENTSIAKIFFESTSPLFQNFSRI